MDPRHLAEHGWTWISSLEQMHLLCESIYATESLEEVHTTVDAVTSACKLPHVYCLGNPLEAMVLHNWMGTVPLFIQRVWWMSLEPNEELVLFCRSHIPHVSHQFLATGRPCLAHWDPGPRPTTGLLLDAAAQHCHAFSLKAHQRSGVAILDNMLVLSPTRQTASWITFQPGCFFFQSKQPSSNRPFGHRVCGGEG